MYNDGLDPFLVVLRWSFMLTWDAKYPVLELTNSSVYSTAGVYTYGAWLVRIV